MLLTILWKIKSVFLLHFNLQMHDPTLRVRFPIDSSVSLGVVLGHRLGASRGSFQSPKCLCSFE